MTKRQRNTFLTPLIVKVMPSGKRFKVASEFTYRWAMPISVPVGFETDFASVPRVCRLIIPKLGRYTKAAVIHDYLYQEHGLKSGGLYFRVSRRTTDKIFRGAMEELGVSTWKRWAMWAAVRVGGFLSWRKR